MSGSKLSDDLSPSAEPARQASAATSQEWGALTVHSLPNTSEVLAAHTHQTALGRWKMLLVLAVCAAPVLASYFAFYVVRPEGRRNFGELIHAQPTVPAVSAQGTDGSSVRLDSLRGQWLLVSVAGAACDPACEQHLYLQRQLRESLGKDKDRLDWVWLIDDDAALPARLQQGLGQATVLRVAPAALGAWLQPAAGHGLHEHLYLIDPMGHWMMRFPAGLDLDAAARAKKDLVRLMNASAGWDTAGRPGAQP